MRPPRFRIRTLMVAIAVAAVVLGAAIKPRLAYRVALLAYLLAPIAFLLLLAFRWADMGKAGNRASAPHPRSLIPRIMIVVAVLGAVAGLVEYRERYLPSFDEAYGEPDKSIVVIVDLGLMCGLPFTFVMGIALYMIARVGGWLDGLWSKDSEVEAELEPLEQK